MHFKEKSSEDKTFHGLATRLASPEFLMDLGIMYDTLFELSVLSLSLQERSSNILKAESEIRVTINCLKGLKSNHGTKTLESQIAARAEKFGSIKLETNHRHVSIKKDLFLDGIIKNLEIRLNTVSYTKNSTKEVKEKAVSDYKELLDNFSVLDPKRWPVIKDSNYGKDQIVYLCEKFDLNVSPTLTAFREFTACGARYIPENLICLLNILNVIPISSAECERGFSQMNLICNDLRTSLLIENINNLLFINMNGPPIEKFNPIEYAKVWLREHNNSDEMRNTNHPRQAAKEDVNDNAFWSIL